MSSTNQGADRINEQLAYIRERGAWLEMICAADDPEISMRLWTPPDKTGGQKSIGTNVSAATFNEALDKVVQQLDQEVQP